MAKKYLRSTWFLVCLITLSVYLSGCLYKSPISVGFTAQLTGKQADLGIHLRNGVELAVEEINASGGINGQNLELLVEDDFGTIQGAKDSETRLIDQGAVAIIGHFTSDQTLSGYEVAENRGVLLFSATASTSVMSEKSDLFFRTVASTDAMGRGFASYIYNDRKINSIAVIFDEDNRSYSEPLVNAFTDTFKKSGGKITFTQKFSSMQTPDYSTAVSMMKMSSAEAVFIIASPNDTALITQTIVLQNWVPQLFTSSWAQGDLLFQTGGKTIEGMETIIGFDVNDQTAGLEKFKEDYQQRFGVEPIFLAMEGYETMHLLAKGLQKTNGSTKNLGSELIGIQDYMGLSGPVKLDAYGDVLRNLSIQKIVDGKFVTIKKLDMSE
jgi:branched-chain amino acid transport system substrate-binding protein